MGKVKISPNLFLEVNELNRMRRFIEDDGYKLIIRNLTKAFGVASSVNTDYFKVSVKAGTSDTVTVNSGVAFDSDLNIIKLKENVDLTIPYSTIRQWIIIRYAASNDEEGTVSISGQGALRGSGTEFLSVLRGQPNFPTKVRFSNSSHNTEEYEVIDVTSDTTATLAGDFTTEDNLKYQVIGTFTPGFAPDDEDKAIYEYDGCEISIIESEDVPSLEDGEFIIASVVNDNGLNVTDERSRNMFDYIQEQDATAQAVSNPLVALRRTALFEDSMMLDIQFEWGYKVLTYEITNTTTSNIFTITRGESKYIDGGTITDGMFAGWLLFNRKNMMSVEIDTNENNALYISRLNSDIVTDSGDDFVIIPNFSMIEVEVKTSGENYAEDDTPFYSRFSLPNAKSRITIPIRYGETTVGLKYRMFNAEGSTTFQNFAVAQFENTQGTTETLGNSSFTITVNRPEEVQRNYS